MGTDGPPYWTVSADVGHAPEARSGTGPAAERHKPTAADP
jgi:hypothetical protein